VSTPSLERQGKGSQGSRLGIGLALFAVYAIWGSTYYVMRVALEALPPFLMAAPRFVVAGSLLYAFLRWRGAPAPTGRQWAASGLVGSLLLVVGNGLVAMAERTVHSGVAATVVATMPIWAAVIGLFWGERPRAREAFGLLAGFAGVLVLQHSGDLQFRAVDSLVLLIAPISWALGSVWSRRLPMPPGNMASATQMIIGGVLMFGVALLRGEQPLAPLTLRTGAALGYLAVFGSLVAFSAYGYLLRHTRPLVATSYAYVNPLVALLLGAAMGGERLSADKLVACGLTIFGVLVVTLGGSRGAALPAKASDKAT
jgi:drug/metabolite transporter (DMT)-like permease